MVTGSPGLLVAATRWVPESVAVVHHERMRPSQRQAATEALRSCGDRLALVVVPEERSAEAVRRMLAHPEPPVRVVADPVAPNAPRSTGRAPIITLAGQLIAEQQIGTVITAFAEVSDRLTGWRLRIFGRGLHRAAVEGAVRKSRVFDRVEILPPSSDLAIEWARSSFSICTTRGPAPLVVSEAMAAGIPVIAHHYPGGAATQISHGVEGMLIDPRSTRALAGAIAGLGLDPQLRGRMAAAALTRAAAQLPPPRRRSGSRCSPRCCRGDP